MQEISWFMFYFMNIVHSFVNCAIFRELCNRMRNIRRPISWNSAMNYMHGKSVRRTPISPQPRDRVSIAYAGGGVSRSHNTTVFLTLNNHGLSCSLERKASFLLWFLNNCSLWVSTLVFLLSSTTESRQLHGVASLSILRFPSRFSSSPFWSFFAWISTFFRSWRWKSCLCSYHQNIHIFIWKHPLLGILNFKNFGIKSAHLQLQSTFTRVFS